MDTDAVLKSVMEGGGLLNPDYNKEGRQSPIQQTLAIIKPDAMPKSEEIINVIKKEGFAVLQVSFIAMVCSWNSHEVDFKLLNYFQTRKVQLSAEQAASFYQDAYQAELFSERVTYLSSGPILAMILSGPLAVQHLREFFGPATSWLERSENTKCLKYIYGKKGSDYEDGLHSSETEEDALRELHFFFPEGTLALCYTIYLSNHSQIINTTRGVWVIMGKIHGQMFFIIRLHNALIR